MTLRRAFCKNSRRHAEPKGETKNVSKSNESAKQEKKPQWKAFRKSKILVKKMATKAPWRLRIFSPHSKRYSDASLSSASETSMIPHVSCHESVKDSFYTLNEIISPYLNMNSTREPILTCELNEPESSDSSKDSGEMLTRSSSISSHNYGCNTPTVEYKSARCSTPSVMDQNLKNIEAINKSPTQKDKVENDPILLADLSNGLSFDNDMMSHSTSRRNSISCQIEIGNSTEFASINDANVQIFKKHNDFKNQVRVVRQQPLLSNNRLSYNTGRRPFSEDYFLSRRDSSTPKLKYLETERFRDSMSRRHVANSMSGQYGVFSRDSTVELSFTSNEHVFRQEILLLIEKHRLLVSKQQQKIAHLENLLTQEKKLNAYLSTSPKLSNQRASTASTETKRQKYRGRFLPIQITLPEKEIPSTNYSGALLPPFDSDVKRGFSMHNCRPSYAPTAQMRGKSVNDVAEPVPKNRMSTASSIYYSAIESSFNEDAKLLALEKTIHEMDRPNKKLTRNPSISSSISSIMSGSHKLSTAGNDISASNNSTNSASDPSNLSSGLSTYSIQSNLTTPETINMQSAVFVKKLQDTSQRIGDSYITSS